MKMKAAVLLLVLLAAMAAHAQSGGDTELFREAEDHYRAGNTLLALERFEDFARRYPLSDRMPDAQYRIGVCRYRLGRYAEAVETFRRVESRYATTRYLDLTYFWAGMANYHLGRWGDAVAAFERFDGRLADAEANAQALLYRSISEVELGLPAAAVRSLDRLLGAYPQSPLAPHALLRLMDLNLRSGDAAAVLAIDVTRLPPEWQARGRLYHAEALWRLDRRQEAAPLYESLRAEEPALATSAYQRLFALAQASGDLAAMEKLAAAAEGSLGDEPGVLEDLWLRVGAESLQRSDLDSAAYFLRRSWERGGAGAGTAGRAAPRFLSTSPKSTSARAASTRLPPCSRRPRPGQARHVTLRLADVRLMQERFADAAPLYDRAAGKASTPVEANEARAQLAYCRYRLGEHAAALAITTRLLEAGAGGAQGAQRLEVLRLHAAILAAQGSLDPAAAALTELLAASPADARASLDLIRVLFRKGDYREAVRRAGTAAAAAASDPYTRIATLYFKALAEVALKRHGDAIDSLRAITPAATAGAGLSALDPYVLYYRAWALYRRGDFAAARDQLSALLERFPAHALRQESLYLAGWCLFSLSDHRRALPLFKEVSETVGPRAQRATLLYGKSLAALGRLEEALAVFQGLGRSQGDLADDGRFEAAAALATLGRIDAAAAAYRDMATAFPGSPLAEEALYRRGTLYREAGRNADAAAAFTDYRSRFPSGAQVDGALYWGGLSSLDSGHAFGAVLLWEILVDRYRASPYRVDALRRMAAIYEQRGEPDRALALLQRLASDYPEEAASLRDDVQRLRLVQAGSSEREAALTVRIQREGGASSAGGRAAMLDLATLYVRQRPARLDDAQKLLTPVLASGDAALTARARYLSGELRDARGETVEAAREFVAAAAAASGDADLAPSALYRAAEAMSRAGRREDTKQLVDRLERSFPGSSWTLEARRLLEVSR